MNYDKATVEAVVEYLYSEGVRYRRRNKDINVIIGDTLLVYANIIKQDFLTEGEDDNQS